jgi:putative hydrolase of the HAD superfamily
MSNEIKAIFLDVGNTLRILMKDPLHQAQARQKIVALVGTQEDPEIFCQRLDARYKIYRKWAFEHLVEAHEAELWTRWMAPEFPADKIAPLGVELTYQYRQSMGRRVLQKDAKEVVVELDRRGYILGIISNVITSQELPDWLEADNLAKYFKSVVLSSTYGKRKPDPAIYLEAARRAGVLPEHCAYVGDNLTRDVVGARRAGFGRVVILLDPTETVDDALAEANKPDVIIHQFRELLDQFLGRQVR